MTTSVNPSVVSKVASRGAGNSGSRWFNARPWQTNLTLIFLGTILLLLSHHLVSEYTRFTIGFSGVSGWQAILYVIAVWLILTQPVDRLTLPIILAVALACRLATLFAEPYLSSDIYRYVWDGIVQHARISPYRYVPGDPVLAFLRAPHQQIFEHINRRETARTIYPPAAQVFFSLITWISPTVTFMKTAMIFFEGITIAALLAVLKHLGERKEQILLYAWCPLLIWEVAGAGHLDSAAMAFVALALLFRYRKQPILSGLFLGVAILLKLYPLVLLPALYRRGDYKMPATVVAVIALGYAAYSGVGLLVFGFLGGYVQEEGVATGSRYFLLELAQRVPGLQNLPTTAYFAFCALVFDAILLWSWRTASQQGSDPASFLSPAFVLAAALMFLFSPHYAWYVIWLIPFFTLMPNLPILAYLMSFFYLFTTPLAVPGPKMFLLNKILYGAVLAAGIIHVITQPWPWRRSHFVQPTPASEPL